MSVNQGCVVSVLLTSWCVSVATVRIATVRIAAVRIAAVHWIWIGRIDSTMLGCSGVVQAE